MKWYYYKQWMSFYFLLFAYPCLAQVSNLTEGFNNISPNTTNPVSGWVAVNNSEGNVLPGVHQWFDGGSYLPPFLEQAGPYEGSNCVVTDYLCTQAPGGATISNWLISPVLQLANGGVVKFWTSTTANQILYADRLQVRLSIQDNSVNVGSTPTSVGDFTSLLAEINPTQTINDVSQGGYPIVWTQYTVALSGLPVNATGRIAFRYFVTDGGANGSNAMAIMIDDFSYSSSSLPVTLLKFEGKAKKENNVLLWSTATESHNNKFRIQRMQEDNQFLTIGELASKATNGNSNTLISYEFLDNNPLKIDHFYRLEQVDIDGKVTYSKIVSIKRKSDEITAFYIYPVPAHDKLHVSFSAVVPLQADIIVVDGTGRTVVKQARTLRQGRQTVEIDISSLSRGWHSIQVIGRNKDVKSEALFMKL